MTSPAGCTFVVSSRIGLQTAEPYIEAAIGHEFPVTVCCPSELHTHVRQRYPVEVLDLSAVARNRSRLRAVHTAMTVLLASPKATRAHLLLNDPRSVATTPTGRAARAVARFTAQLQPRRLNAVVDAALRPLHRNPFPTRAVIAVSFCSEPYLLTARDQQVTTVIESWDHPTKKPAGYRTDIVVGWNVDICDDWMQFQGARHSLTGFPAKLTYAFDAAASSTTDSSDRTIGRRAMYCVGTSSNTDRTEQFEDELAVIEEICAATEEAGWRLLIKPKPNGRSGDFDAFADRYAHVDIGAYRDSSSALDYYLDDEYNRTRSDELASCDLVINCWTTYGLDAAIAGRPVLQLDLRRHVQWPALAAGCQNHHLATYLVGRQHAFRPDPDRPLVAELSERLRDPWITATAFSADVRSWLEPSTHVRTIADTVVLRAITA